MLVKCRILLLFLLLIAFEFAFGFLFAGDTKTSEKHQSVATTTTPTTTKVGSTTTSARTIKCHTFDGYADGDDCQAAECFVAVDCYTGGAEIPEFRGCFFNSTVQKLMDGSCIIYGTDVTMCDRCHFCHNVDYCSGGEAASTSTPPKTESTTHVHSGSLASVEVASSSLLLKSMALLCLLVGMAGLHQ